MHRVLPSTLPALVHPHPRTCTPRRAAPRHATPCHTACAACGRAAMLRRYYGCVEAVHAPPHVCVAESTDAVRKALRVGMTSPTLKRHCTGGARVELGRWCTCRRTRVAEPECGAPRWVPWLACALLFVRPCTCSSRRAPGVDIVHHNRHTHLHTPPPLLVPRTHARTRTHTVPTRKVAWTKPSLGVFSWNNSTANNIVLGAEGCSVFVKKSA